MAGSLLYRCSHFSRLSIDIFYITSKENFENQRIFLLSLFLYVCVIYSSRVILSRNDKKTYLPVKPVKIKVVSE
jgi:hypothetical protein